MSIVTVFMRLFSHIRKAWNAFTYFTSGWLFSLIIYIAACSLASLGSAMIPLWSLKAVVILAVPILFATTTMVRFRFAGASETEVSDLKSENDRLSQELERAKTIIGTLKDTVRNQRNKIIDASWIWEINLAQIQCQYDKLFDCFLESPDAAPIAWSERPAPAAIKDGAYRVVGGLRVDYLAKAGIDLKQVMISKDTSGNVIRYCLPEPRITGTSNARHRWPIRLAMKYGSRLFGSKHWEVLDDGNPRGNLTVWEKEGTDALQHVTDCPELDSRLAEALRNDADRRLKGFFSSILGRDCVSIPREQLSSPITFGEYLQLQTRQSEALLLNAYTAR